MGHYLTPGHQSGQDDWYRFHGGAARGDREAGNNSFAKPADAAEPKGRCVIVWNMDDTMERLGGDEQLFHEVVEIFLDDVPKHMTTLAQAIADGNTEAIEQVAHTLKGELGYLGISEVSRKAREMEELGQKADVRLAASLYETFEPELCELLISMRRMVGAKPGVEMIAGRQEAGQ